MTVYFRPVRNQNYIQPDQINMAMILWRLEKSEQWRTLDKSLLTRYQKHRAMLIRSPCMPAAEWIFMAERKALKLSFRDEHKHLLHNIRKANMVEII